MKNDYRNDFPFSPLLKEQKSQMDEKEYYREKIIEMVRDIKRQDILIYVFKLTKDIILEDYDDGDGLQERR